MNKTIDGNKPCVFRCERGHEFVASTKEVMTEGVLKVFRNFDDMLKPRFNYRGIWFDLSNAHFWSKT
jgi:hypothetical protein